MKTIEGIVSAVYAYNENLNFKNELLEPSEDVFDCGVDPSFRKQVYEKDYI